MVPSSCCFGEEGEYEFRIIGLRPTPIADGKFVAISIIGRCDRAELTLTSSTRGVSTSFCFPFVLKEPVGETTYPAAGSENGTELGRFTGGYGPRSADEKDEAALNCGRLAVRRLSGPLVLVPGCASLVGVRVAGSPGSIAEGGRASEVASCVCAFICEGIGENCKGSA